jgi:hypothetical protein
MQKRICAVYDIYYSIFAENVKIAKGFLRFGNQ